MPNRSERRAQSKGKNKSEQGFTRPNMRSRAGLLDEFALQDKAQRLSQHEGGEWKPSGGRTSVLGTMPASYRNPQLRFLPHSVRQGLRLISWTLIALSIIAFFVVMWLNSSSNIPIIIVSIVFALSVLSLFFVTGDARHNPNLDEHGTAV